ncbi:hypothetical protein CANTEDRAFT_114783 [Yamadazyma tenuis ATCC 10573]|uniref:Cyclin N-terminal domain-containing protein n=1 Tax=Candida tenuis (strain ATCC 10573 / BCRC 21748 / CBS 615 / JCM 9827 / NBRC 10315 / NRRL Y-1498 / VKM Y-70) TaxID=590646 RepID=G3B6H7_CANTC|nr:uncharacterized protein CANTEDRAFT_114783 [Yamadazyma tenuis ATCC 10573]EGV63690.1 hypothetical protein CANTEDRAFT_114783 [Yamadazyma tenuis ATCC 10573]
MDSVDSKAIELFIKSPIDQDLVQKVIVKTLQIIPCDKNSTVYVDDDKKLPSVSKFLNTLIQALDLNNGILMSTVVYLNRLKSKLPKNCKGLTSTRHRILLSCLILSIKFNNDFSMKNYDWLKLTNKLFNLKDINLMERQLLYLLNWHLLVNEFELFHHFSQLLCPIKDNLMNKYRMKQYLKQQQKLHATSPKILASSPQTGTGPFPAPPITPISASPISSQRSFESHPISSTFSTIRKSIPVDVNPLIELTALNEQYQLNKLLESFHHTTL